MDSQTAAPVGGARVSSFQVATNTSSVALSDSAGWYVMPLLPPGTYRVRVEASGYQAREVHELELPIAARLELDFRLRPLSDVWEAGQYRSVLLPGSGALVTFYGPDVDTSRSASFEASRGSLGALETSASQVVDPVQVRELPLAGRDLYTMLLVQPGVTADSATARGLGLSANGQRPSSSNFLLDGLENNNSQITGPLGAVSPEAVQEYRVSTNNFSAEYGRTSGFLANAVTRAGGAAWHGIGYFHRNHEALNANTFQRNTQGLPRPPSSQSQVGYHAGGPLPGRRGLAVSSALEGFRSRGEADPVVLTLPASNFAARFTAPESLARRLLTQFSPPAVSAGNLPVAKATFSPPASVDRSLALQRLDYRSPGGLHHLMGRFSWAGLSRPEFIWTPYRDFVSGLQQDSYAVALTWQAGISPRIANEFRLGWARDTLGWERARPDIPILVEGFEGTVLPGSPAFYSYSNRIGGVELAENLLWAQGRHIVKFGGGFLLRSSEGFLTAGRDGIYLFGDVIDFGLDAPGFFYVPVSRSQLPSFRLPTYERSYRYRQFHLFAQDTLRLTGRLVLNYGLRYESFGAPRNTGAEKDALLALGPGPGLENALPGARLVFPASGDQQLYGSDRNDWALRFGASYSLGGSAGTLLRAAYGIFYDRPFDNLWQNVRSNNFALASLALSGSRVNYLEPIAAALQRYQGQRFAGDFPSLTLVDAGLRNAYVQSYLAGIQQRISETWSLEAHLLGSLGRKLVTTDIVNRLGSRPGRLGNESRWNPSLFDVSYRANQGGSSYHALAVTARHRGARGQFHLAYTWSHAIDNQSEPLAGDFFDLSFTRITGASGRSLRSAFSRQHDSRADRASADFDQRHNLVFFSIWQLPAAFGSSKAAPVFRDWRFSQLAAFRSGFPYTVVAPSRFDGRSAVVLNNRADVLDPSRAAVDATAPGGRRLLDAAAFREPAAGTLGNTGRNAFGGPGVFSIDLSVSRSFPLPCLGEAGRVTFRADAFNFLNHANLNNPDALLGSPTFGHARYGRQGRESGFPALTPFTETARQVQLLLRVEF